MNETKIPFDQELFQNLSTTILAEAKQLGASDAEVDINVHKGFTVTACKQDVESVEYHQDKSIDITVYFGQKTGTAGLSDLRLDAIRDAVKAACHIAKYTDIDHCAGLADKNLLAFNYPTLDLFYPWPISVEEAIELACQCEKEALEADPRVIHCEGVNVITSEAFSVYANTAGFMGAYPLTRHEMSCVLIAKQGEEMQRDYSYTSACDPALLTSISDLAKEATNRTVTRLGSQKLSTRRVPVLFAAEEARTLLGHLIAAISGGALYRQSSFLLNHLDHSIFPSFITIQEHPHLAKGLGSAPFDEDGVSTRPNVFVQDGILKSYSLGIYSARKLGMQTTGNAGGVHNLSITTGQKDLNALLKTMDKGLLVTELMGNGTSIITGDYSQGAAGFWVENGMIQYPVHEITIASNLKEMYRNLVEVGKDIDYRGNIRTGSILIDSMMVAGH